LIETKNIAIFLAIFLNIIVTHINNYLNKKEKGLRIRKKEHVLTKNRLTWVPSRLLFFDTESYLKQVSPTEIEHTFRLGTAIYVEITKTGKEKRRETYKYQSKGEFLNIILSLVQQKTPLYVFAANVWYDLRNTDVLTGLVDHRFEITTFINKARVVIIHVKGKEGTIFFLDTLNYLPFAVKQLGEKIGKPKLEVNFDRVSDRDLMRYCLRDTEIITEAMLEWIRFIYKENLGGFAKSLASQALAAFRHRFMHHRIVIHNKKHIVEIERAGYFGGRTECFYIGKVKETPIYDLDVNSMYPYVMASYDVPIRHIGYLENPTLEKLGKLLTKYCIIAEVEIETDKPYYPLRQKGKCIYPIGRFTTTLPTASLIRAYNYGHIKRINKLAAYIKANIFKDYVTYFYNLKEKAKKKGKKIDYILAKLFLNSLYGKFGQKVDKIISTGELKKTMWGREEVYYADTKKHTVINYLGNRWEELELNAEEGWNTFVAIAAHITDYARNVLVDYIEKAGWENVYYCDTDSLFTNEKGYQRLQDDISNVELGKLKLEKKINHLVIYGLKDYIADDTIKIKGIPQRAVKKDDNTYIIEIFPKALSDLKEGITKPYKTIKRIKILKRQYDKGIVTDSGKVIPISMA